jgi:hypothetical protein
MIAALPSALKCKWNPTALKAPEPQALVQHKKEIPMITEDYVRSIFKGLENGDGASFFEHVADDVDWTVMGHPSPCWPLQIQGRFHRRHFRQARQGAPEWGPTRGRASDRQGRSSRGGASFPCDGQKRHEVRQPVLLGRPLRRQGHRPRPRLSGLGHGRPPLRREPHLGDAQMGFE